MIWIVSNRLISSSSELEKRHQFIQEITKARVTPWQERKCKSERFAHSDIIYHQCRSEKGEYGIVITAHMNLEVQAILRNELSRKKAVVAVNSCSLEKRVVDECCSIIRARNMNSEVLFAKQELSPDGTFSFNYIDDVGTFGFPTSISERELFRYRGEGLIKSIHKAFNKVATGE